MRKTIPEIQKEIVSAIKKSGIDTDYSLFMKMGVKGEVNMHKALQKTTTSFLQNQSPCRRVSRRPERPTHIQLSCKRAWERRKVVAPG